MRYLRGWGGGSVGSVCCGSSLECHELDLVAGTYLSPQWAQVQWDSFTQIIRWKTTKEDT